MSCVPSSTLWPNIDRAAPFRITRDEAAAAGLFGVVHDFERIDTSGRGAVSFDELKQRRRRRGAAL